MLCRFTSVGFRLPDVLLVVVNTSNNTAIEKDHPLENCG